MHFRLLTVKQMETFLWLTLHEFSVHGILQARVLEWVAIPFSRASFLPRDRTWVSHIAGRFFTTVPPKTEQLKDK